jgi:hypothetical protein
MRKVLLVAILPLSIFIAACGTTGHGGNCGCPKFGKAGPKQHKTEQVAVSGQNQDLQ